MTRYRLFRPAVFVVCAVPALCAALLAFDTKSSSDTEAVSATDATSKYDVTTSLSWGDVDGDGLEDVFATYANAPDRLFRNQGDGSFVDVSAAAGFAIDQHSDAALWADFNCDGKVDLYLAAARAERRLFENRGNGTLCDVTAEFGLGMNVGVHDATWLDYERDGFPDLVLKTVSGDRVFHNAQGTSFELIRLGLPIATPSKTARSAAGGEDNAQPARDAREVTGGPLWERGAASGSRGPGTIEAIVGPVSGATAPPHGMATGSQSAFACSESMEDYSNPTGPCIEASSTPIIGLLYPMSVALNVSSFGNVGIGTFAGAGAKLEVAGTTSTQGFSMAVGASSNYVLTCDSSGTGTWQPLPATSGFISGSGTAGTLAKFTASGVIGTAGAALMTDTLILGPSHDTALALNSGSVYKNGSLFLHTKGGSFNDNTGLGHEALQNVLPTGSANTGMGYRALRLDTSGSQNSAYGFGALTNNTLGNSNTATGFDALGNNMTGERNTASGKGALFNNTTGNRNTASGFHALASNANGMFNVAMGYEALVNMSNGLRNIAIGNGAGINLAGGSDNILIGNAGVGGDLATTRIGTTGIHTKAFIAGVRGITTGIANCVPVVIDSAGQLGTVCSSRRFKKDIADMDDLTEGLLGLRPVVFHYNQEQVVPSGEVPLEYGLIAEEVAELFPDLVIYDDDGKPFTVKYHLLSSMLLNELKRLDARVKADSNRLHGIVQAKEQEIAALQDRMTQLERALSMLTTMVEARQ